MLCQKCHKNLATGRYSEVVSGKVNELHLCPDCLAKQQNADAAGFELSGPVTVQRTPAEARLDRSRSKTPRLCKSCGTRLLRVLETGRVGCGACYPTFAEELEPLLNGIHGNVHHVGKSPQVDDMRARLREDLQNKRAILRRALQSENYEEAAQLRDEIRQLETVLNSA